MGAHIIRKYMTPAAADRAKNSKWDPERNYAISQEEEEYEALTNQIENEYDWLQNPNNDTMIAGLPPNPSVAPAVASARTNNIFNYAPEDDESLGTYGQLTHATPTGNKRSAKVTPKKTKSKSKKSSTTPPVLPAQRFAEDLTDDEQTVDTLASRLTTLENRMTNLVNALNANMQAITEAGPGQAKSKSKRRSRKPAGSMNGPAGGL